MIHSQGTQVQKWSKSLSVTVATIILLIHIGSTVLVLLYCPELLHRDSFKGVHCETSIGVGRGNTSCENCESDCVVKSDGESVSLSNIVMSFKFPHSPDLGYWNWKLTSSLSVYLKIYGDELISSDSNLTSLLDLEHFTQPVTVSGSLDYALNKNLEELGKDSKLSSAWHSKARIQNVERTLKCSLMQMPSPTDSLESELPFVCTLMPTLELFPLSNSTYLLTLQIRRQQDHESFDLVEANATIASHLTIVTEDELFHQLKFYMKCSFSPIILFSLIWFLVRLCFNDLYVNIPDRLVITASVVQILANIPTELISSHVLIPYLYLVDPACQVVILTVLAMFWIIFTQDKLANNEPWERNTRYYWKSLLSILLGGIVALLTIIYLNLPYLSNPFNNHWQPGATLTVALSLMLSLVAGVAVFQSYLAVIVFKVICDISIHYPTTSRAWRLKGVLVYSLCVSLVTSLGLLLTLVLTLVLHWTPAPPHSSQEFLPWGVSVAGSLQLVHQLTVNIHIVFLLLALSRSCAPGEGWYAPVRPVIFSPQHREEQLHLWDLSAHPGPLDKLVK